MGYDAVQYDDNNIFAKILRGEVPCHKVYESERTLAFMDLMPQSPGHILVAPKVKAVNLLDIPAKNLQDLIADVQIVARAALEAFSADGVSVFQFNGEAAGQTVFHLHFHIVPRYAGEVLTHHASEQVGEDVLEQQAERVRTVLAR
ncbi:MAG: HIT family protein [Methylobacteriaceae bacterium]|jgi:histidine triad (HIT) family protein|nr:HIT family protein [Methylobacteriaceae bacterium]